ncbi:MAG: hypothetical protein H8D72_01000, partial [Planctomycetes bacterium]|nr:hypothetical protein [Planctomycetota bacterium]
MSKLSDLPLPVVLGLSLAGALVGFVLATFLAPSAKSGSELHVGEVSAAESRGADLENTRARTVEELERELMRLTAQLDAEPRSMRQRADATAPRPNSQPSDPELESAEPLTANSLALLQAVLAEYGSEEFANAIEAQAAADSVDAVARALFFAYTNAQRPYDAERVLDLFVSLGAGFQPNPWELSNLASQFATLGDTGRATDLLGRALRLDPNNFDFANRLADLDPALGLAAFNEANQDGKLTERYEGRRNLALFLIKGGDLEGGLAMLHNPDGTLEPNAWDLFFEHAPEQALTELREAAKDDPYGTLGMRLARHLGSHDNVAEALETLEGMLLQNPSNTQAMAYLAELDPERVDADEHRINPAVLISNL